MSEQTENKLLIIAAIILYGVVGGMEMREQQEFEEQTKQYVAQKTKPKKPAPPTSSPQPQKCKIRTKIDTCIVRLA